MDSGRYIIYFGGLLVFAKGLLVFFGTELPKRDGTVIDDPSKYGLETMALGIAIVVLTFVISNFHDKHKGKND